MYTIDCIPLNIKVFHKNSNNNSNLYISNTRTHWNYTWSLCGTVCIWICVCACVYVRVCFFGCVRVRVRVRVFWRASFIKICDFAVSGLIPTVRPLLYRHNVYLYVFVFFFSVALTQYVYAREGVNRSKIFALARILWRSVFLPPPPPPSAMTASGASDATIFCEIRLYFPFGSRCDFASGVFFRRINTV